MPMIRASKEIKQILDRMKERMKKKSIEDLMWDLISVEVYDFGITFKRTWKPYLKYLRPIDFPLGEIPKPSKELDVLYVAIELSPEIDSDILNNPDWFTVTLEKGLETIAKEHPKYSTLPLLVTGIRQVIHDVTSNKKITKIILYAIYPKITSADS